MNGENVSGEEVKTRCALAGCPRTYKHVFISKNEAGAGNPYIQNS